MAYNLGDLKSLISVDPVQQDMQFLKISLRNSIILRMREKGWTQQQAADVMGVSQPRVSALNQAKLEEFSIEKLIEMLLKTGSRLQVDSKESDGETAFLAMTFNKVAI